MFFEHYETHPYCKVVFLIFLRGDPLYDGFGSPLEGGDDLHMVKQYITADILCLQLSFFEIRWS